MLDRRGVVSRKKYALALTAPDSGQSIGSKDKSGLLLQRRELIFSYTGPAYFSSTEGTTAFRHNSADGAGSSLFAENDLPISLHAGNGPAPQWPFV